MIMGFKDLVGKAQELTGSASETVTKVLDEFNEALPTMRALGFTIKNLKVGMGLMPEVGATLVASTDTVDVEKIHELIEKNAEKKLLVTALKGLEAAYNVKQQIGDLPLKGVELDITLGLPPHIGVQFVSSTPASASGEGRAAHA
jgi:hypothetical protein